MKAQQGWKKNKLSVAVGVAAMAASWPGAAQESALETIVVTASRIEQSTLEAPSNVSVVTKDTLEKSGAIRVGDALTAKVPSFYMRGGGTGTSGKINSTPIVTMRGQYNRVKMMVDGLGLADGNNGGPASILGINVGDVEQIEVAPGVSSALYGSDAVGGVVNIITKAPTKQEFNARYVRGFGDGERSAYEASYRNRWENGFAASISAGYEDIPGMENSDLVVLPVGTTGTGANALQGGKKTTTDTGDSAYVVGNKGATPAHQGFLNTKFYYSLDARSKFFAGYSHTEGKMGYDDFNVYLTKNGVPLTLPASNTSINGDKLGPIAQKSFWNSSNPNRREEDRYTAGYDGKLGENIDLKVNLGYFDRESSYVSSGTGATFDEGPGTQTSTPNTTFDGSVQFGFGLGENQYVIAGLSNYRSTLDRKVYQVNNWRHPENTKTGVLSGSSEAESTTNGIFLQDQVFLTDALTLYVGGRFDRWTTEGKSVSPTYGTTVVPERSESAFSPKVAAVYRLNDALSLRSSVGRAFRAPSNYELYATASKSGNRLLIADPKVGPEKALSWDIGIEQALADQGYLKAAYYDTKMSDMIYRKIQPHTGGMTGIVYDAILTNAAEAEIRGVELSAEVSVTNWLRVSASYTYTDSEITKDDNVGLEGKVLRYIPKNMASIGLDAKWQKWRGVITTTYTGLQYSNEDNSDVVKDVYGGVSKYWLTNLNVSYQIDKNFKASLLVNNLFDKTYYEYYLMPGRYASIELSAAF